MLKCCFPFRDLRRKKCPVKCSSNHPEDKPVAMAIAAMTDAGLSANTVRHAVIAGR